MKRLVEETSKEIIKSGPSKKLADLLSSSKRACQAIHEINTFCNEYHKDAEERQWEFQTSYEIDSKLHFNGKLISCCLNVQLYF